MTKKVALVTGGTGGIGTAICQQLLNDGYAVATTFYRQQLIDQWLADEKLDVFASRCDITNWESCQAMAKEVTDKLGPVDVLVNNAGITSDATFRKMTPDIWNNVINTNLNSVFYVTKQFFDSMLERQYGRIINISSVNGQKGQFGQTNYSAAKAGIHGFSKALAQEAIRKGVTVNTVSPGYVATKMVKQIPQEVQDKITSTIPAGRFAEPLEIARIVGFLADENAGYITGANFSANGGLHMY